MAKILTRTGVTVAVLLFSTVMLLARTPGRFERDVHTAILRGSSWLAANGYLAVDQNGNAEAGEATPLVLLALLEKPVAAGEGAQGYRRAPTADRSHIDRLMDVVVRRQSLGFMAYRNGPEMMALSVYLMTGGPDRRARAALDRAVDESLDAIGQAEPCGAGADGCGAVAEARAPRPCGKGPYRDDRGCRSPFRMPTPEGVAAWHGYWGYLGVDGQDSSTTQFVAAGLAAARQVYRHPRFRRGDQLGIIDAVLTRSRQAYEAHGLYGQACSPGGVLSAAERGHGYVLGPGSACELYGFHAQNSAQQTSAGLWVQLVGGSDVNQPGVQGYLEWLRNRFAFTSAEGQPFSTVSYGYHLWTSARAYQFMERSGVTPHMASLTTRDLGRLTRGESPAFAFRETHLNPRDLPRPEAFGPGRAGYYAEDGASAGWFFDYAYTLLSRQDEDGAFGRPNGAWEPLSEQAYYLLILERSLGGVVPGGESGSCDEGDGSSEDRSDDASGCRATALVSAQRVR